MRIRRVHLEPHALAHERVHGVEAIAHQVVGPGEERPRLGGEEIDGGLGDVGKARPALLGADVGGHAPVALLADEPEPVGDRVGEAALALEELAQDEIGQLAAAGEEELLVAPAVAVAHVVQEASRGQDRPLRPELPLGLGDEDPPLRVRDLGPGGAVRDRGVRAEGVGRCEGRREVDRLGLALEEAAGSGGARRRERPREARGGRGRRGGRRELNGDWLSSGLSYEPETTRMVTTSLARRGTGRARVQRRARDRISYTAH